MRPDTLAVIGLGAIGGSVAWQARQAGVGRVLGFDPDPATAVAALKAGAIHDRGDTLQRTVAAADLVILAAPPARVLAQLGELPGLLPTGALVTDVASIKEAIVERANAVGLGQRFAGSHPYAGTHLSGWAGARPDRFRGAIVYVTSTGPAGDEAAREIMDFWQGTLEAQPVMVEPARHDRQLAWTSHLPQVVASALAGTLAGAEHLRGASVGTGLLDTTRLAASPPALWVDVLLLNRQRVLEALTGLGTELGALEALLTNGDGPGLREWLERAADFRRRQGSGPQ